MPFELIVVLAASLGTVVLGLFTYYKNPKSATNILFIVFTLVLSLYNLVNYAATHQTSNEYTFFFVKQIMSIAALINLTFFLLVSTFPYPKLPFNKLKLWFYIAFTLLIIALAQMNLIFSSVTLTESGTNSIPGPAMPLFLLQTFGFLGAGFYTLIKKFRHSTGTERRQFTFLFAGTVIMFSAIIITNLLFVILLNTTALIQLLPLYTFTFVGIISYAIIKHQFLDIGLLLYRTVTFTLITLVILSIYAIGLFSFINFFPAQYQTPFTILLALILVYSYNPLKRAIETLTKDVFFKQPYSPEDFLETLGEIIRSTLVMETLAHKVLNELIHTLPVSRGAVVIFQEGSDHHLFVSGYDQRPEFSENTLHNFRVAAKKSLVVFDNLEEGPVKMLLRQHQLHVIMPLKIKSTFHGLLLLGEKASGEIYSKQDIDVLEILMPQLSVAIQNAQSYEEIKGFADKLKEEVRLATTDLRKANRHLKHMDKLKDEFVYVATHELKNPVTAMKGYLSMLNEGLFGPIPTKMAEPIEQMNYSNQQLVDLVNDLLQVARAEVQALTIDTQPVDLKPLIQDVIDNLKPLSRQKHLTVSYDPPKKANLVVLSDPIRLKEIVNNLISNAIKYSDQGTIIVSHEHNEDKVITHVEDHGHGIAPKDQAKIFSKFFRVDEEMAKGIPGTGLGLFIVKHIVEKMNGKIWFNSVFGKGTIFSFSLPKAPKV